MAQDRLIRSAAVVVLVGGVAVERTAAAPALLTVGDLAAGASLALAALLLARSRPLSATVAVVAAGLWFLGTVAGADSGSSVSLAALGSLLLLVHRGPLLHLLLRTGRVDHRSLVAAGYVAALMPLPVVGPVTSSVALVVAAVALASGARQRRVATGAVGAVAAALGAIWLLAWSLGDAAVGVADALAMADDVAVVLVAAVAVVGDRYRVSTLVVDLEPGAGAASPVSARLSRVLGDPALEIAFRIPDGAWVDESGRRVQEPSGGNLTRVGSVSGGEVTLVHGEDFSGDPALAQAAARAALLALDTARLDAETRERAREVRESRVRLLSAGDAERRALEQRLSGGPLRRLRRVDQLLADVPDATLLREETRATSSDLRALAAGLFPVSGGLDVALRAVAERASVPVDLDLPEHPLDLAEPQLVALCFVAAEVLTNVAKHARATRVTLSLRGSLTGSVLTITDDGRGGAVVRRGGGLAGLVDRVEAVGGRLGVLSPAGGPTVLEVVLTGVGPHGGPG